MHEDWRLKTKRSTRLKGGEGERGAAGRGDTRLVELFARDYVNPCYYRVAALGGLDYRPVVAAGPGAPREERTANGMDIAMAAGAVLAAVG